MPIPRVVCPECGAGMKSAAGFAPGQTIACPKCGVYFSAEAPPAPRVAVVELAEDDDPPPKAKPKRPVVAEVVDDDEDEDDRPRPKKGKTKRKEPERWAYTRSPIRIVVIGMLLAVLGVLSVLLYFKWQSENRPWPAYVKSTARDNIDRDKVEELGSRLIGKWEAGGRLDVAFEFRPDGALITRALNRKGQQQVEGTWSIYAVRGETLSIEAIRVPPQ